MTHDYKRHGTTTLFAALDVLEGKVIGRCMHPLRSPPVRQVTSSRTRWVEDAVELLADIPIAAYIRSFNRGW